LKSKGCETILRSWTM